MKEMHFAVKSTLHIFTSINIWLNLPPTHRMWRPIWDEGQLKNHFFSIKRLIKVRIHEQLNTFRSSYCIHDLFVLVIQLLNFTWRVGHAYRLFLTWSHYLLGWLTDFKHALVLEPQNKVASLAEKRLKKLIGWVFASSDYWGWAYRTTVVSLRATTF